MGLFRKQHLSEDATAYQPESILPEENMAHVRYCASHLLKQMDNYLEQEVDITSCVDAVSAGSETSLNELNSINVTIENICNNYNQFTQTAGNIRVAMDNSEATINEANDSMNHLTLQINNSKQQLQDMMQTFGQLEADFKNITDLTQNITGISSRTNLLALNASIEAARAGEAGRGFAVVAEQIRELSASTASLVQGIETSIKTLYDSLENLQGEIGKTSDLIQNNIEYADNVKDTFNQVKTSTCQAKEASDYIVNEIHSLQDEIKGAVSDADSTRTAIQNIQNEIYNLNQKSELKSVSLYEVVDILHQLSNIAEQK